MAASTMEAIRLAAHSFHLAFRLDELRDGTLAEVRGGSIVSRDSFVVEGDVGEAGVYPHHAGKREVVTRALGEVGRAAGERPRTSLVA
jgi:hypothetical protein